MTLSLQFYRAAKFRHGDRHRGRQVQVKCKDFVVLFYQYLIISLSSETIQERGIVARERQQELNTVNLSFQLLVSGQYLNIAYITYSSVTTIITLHRNF